MITNYSNKYKDNNYYGTLIMWSDKPELCGNGCGTPCILDPNLIRDDINKKEKIELVLGHYNDVNGNNICKKKVIGHTIGECFISNPEDPVIDTKGNKMPLGCTCINFKLNNDLEENIVNDIANGELKPSMNLDYTPKEYTLFNNVNSLSLLSVDVHDIAFVPNPGASVFNKKYNGGIQLSQNNMNNIKLELKLDIKKRELNNIIEKNMEQENRILQFEKNNEKEKNMEQENNTKEKNMEQENNTKEKNDNTDIKEDTQNNNESLNDSKNDSKNDNENNYTNLDDNGKDKSKGNGGENTETTTKTQKDTISTSGETGDEITKTPEGKGLLDKSNTGSEGLSKPEAQIEQNKNDIAEIKNMLIEFKGSISLLSQKNKIEHMAIVDNLKVILPYLAKLDIDNFGNIQKEILLLSKVDMNEVLDCMNNIHSNTILNKNDLMTTLNNF